MKNCFTLEHESSSEGNLKAADVEPGGAWPGLLE
jgi:hypothetical protein